MSTYMTEAEQIEVIKKWWKRYNGIITILLSIILLAVAGFKYWNWHQDKLTQQASNAYEHMMLAYSNQDYKGVRGYANQLIKAHKQSAYADAAHLTLARVYAERAQYPKARDELAYVMAHSNMSALQHIAKIRLVRLLIAEKSYDEALNQLANVDNKAYLPMVNELKGDIFAAKGQYKQAVSSYQEAMRAVKIQGMGNLFLEMKASELSALA